MPYFVVNKTPDALFGSEPVTDAQAGKTDAAIAAWQKLEAEAPAGAPIRAELERTCHDDGAVFGGQSNSGARARGLPGK